MADPNAGALPAIDRTVADLRRRIAAWRADGETVALVPTMGALHVGHIALAAAARGNANRVVASIFVNPAQFAPGEDFASYPRDEGRDLVLLAEAGTDAVFAPPVPEIYPTGFATTVTVSGPSAGLESDFRPHFFAGVATVVAKLLLAALPDIALFGEKDYQQLLVVRRLVADLGIPTTIIGLPTLRDPDGLALSSRNAYLTPAERAVAPTLHAALQGAAEAIRGGTAPELATSTAREELRRNAFTVDYFALRNAETLAPVADPRTEPLRVLAAARLGRTRLIDNIAV